MNSGSAGEEVFQAVSGLLNDSLKLWARIRPNEEARLIAAKGYLLLKDVDPRMAERLNGTLHLLARDVEGISRATGDTDVRPLPPAERHRLIFETWHGLRPGDSFVLLNDHDPKPLYYQFEAEHTGRFFWEELEMGPEVWRVRIGKKED